jgi:hypothetical protein
MDPGADPFRSQFFLFKQPGGGTRSRSAAAPNRSKGECGSPFPISQIRLGRGEAGNGVD